ncbi:VOC family protein [Nocardioides pantholopis]|uniref:VOC family protein n=1 Tax=Nocardioides pantholopis TaxID=2483798 RepID=UPI000F099C9D|nr:VOC family protein [Nocardioides pantholopis]
MPGPRFELANTVLGTPDPRGLAEFYRELLGWQVRQPDDGDPDWVVIKPRLGGTGLSFQREDGHVPPAWPAGEGRQQMQLHLDIAVDDLPAAVARAEQLGATQADLQPQELVRVLLDPAGHPFCLFAPGG